MSIPPDVLNEFLSLKRNDRCALCGAKTFQIHHNLIYGGRKVDEVWALIALCRSCHDMEKRRDIHEKLDWIMLNRGTDVDLRRYSKINNLIKRRDDLNAKYGTPPGE